MLWCLLINYDVNDGLDLFLACVEEIEKKQNMKVIEVVKNYPKNEVSPKPRRPNKMYMEALIGDKLLPHNQEIIPVT